MGLFRSALVALMLTAATGGYAQEHNTLTEEEQAAGWQLLFNGEDMAQWRNFKKDSLHKKWVVQDGTMTLTKKGGGDIVTREQYGEFELQLEWKISEGGNSGIFVLVSEDGRKVYSKAPEIQILDNERHSDRKDPTHRSGSLYDLIAAPTESFRAAGQWNQVRIRLEDRRLQAWQNGVQTTDIVIGSERWNELVAGSKFASWEGFGEANQGYIGLQDHGDVVHFRNLKVLPLDGE